MNFVAWKLAKARVLVLFRLSIVACIDSRYRSRYKDTLSHENEIFSLALYSLHFSFSVTESYSIASKVVVPLSVSFIASIRDAFATHCEDVSNFRMLSRTVWPFEMYASVAYRLFPCHFLFWHWAICLYRDLDILIIQFDSFISSITSDIETKGLRLCEIIIRNIECFIINI